MIFSDEIDKETSLELTEDNLIEILSCLYFKSIDKIISKLDISKEYAKEQWTFKSERNKHILKDHINIDKNSKVIISEKELIAPTENSTQFKKEEYIRKKLKVKQENTKIFVLRNIVMQLLQNLSRFLKNIRKIGRAHV